MSQQNDDATKEAEVQKKKKKISPVMILLVLVAAAVLVGAGVGISTFFIDKDHEEIERVVEFISPAMDFTVNLADPDQRRFLRATVKLGYDQRDLTSEIEEKEAELRDIVINTLRTKTVGEISSVEGTESLRLELMEKLDERLTEGELLEIYFTEFLIQ